jgi:uncharacterized protein YgiM (DUF1202 family)
MKTKFWTVCVALISTSLLAQQDSNAPAAAPADTSAAPAATAPSTTEPTNAPAPAMAPETPAASNAPAAEAPKPKAKHKKKPAAHPSELKTIPLVAGPAVVAANRVNVRGQAGLKGEIIGRMTNGEPVTVVEEIHLKNSKEDEPSAWAKIALPDKLHPWVKASYIDTSSETVKPKTLNMRGGPGENYSVIGTLKRGTMVKEVTTKDGWMQIETANAFAFMAAQYLTQDPVALAAAAGLSNPTNTETIAENDMATEAGTNAPDMTAMTSNGTNDQASATNTIVEPPAPRIVEREGYVRGATSIQAPTAYELISPDTHRIVDYLYSKDNEVDLSRYKGMHIIVTGIEGMDERWKSTPVITVQRIQVIE